MRKVFGIVAVQMLVTFGFAVGASYWYDMGYFVTQLWVQITSWCAMFATMIALICVPGLRKQVPINYILLLLFTVTWGLAIASITAYLTPESVLLAIGVLCAAVGSLAFAALVTPITPKLVMFLLVGLLVGVFAQFFVVLALCFTGYFSSFYFVLYGLLGCAISGLLIFFDVVKIQMMGKVAVDEYILGAMMLYIDIIRLLLYILMLFGRGK